MLPEEEEFESIKCPALTASTKFCTKRVVALKQTQLRSIEDIEKMQLQSRIMMINSVLAVNVAAPQGYKPKPRTWQQSN
jgi:hypothetical protein